MRHPNRYRNTRLRADARQAKVAAALNYWRDSFAGLKKDESHVGQGVASEMTNSSSEQHAQDSSDKPLFHPLRWRGD